MCQCVRCYASHYSSQTQTHTYPFTHSPSVSTFSLNFRVTIRQAYFQSHLTQTHTHTISIHAQVEQCPPRIPSTTPYQHKSVSLEGDHLSNTHNSLLQTLVFNFPPFLSAPSDPLPPSPSLSASAFSPLAVFIPQPKTYLLYQAESIEINS